nr:hypothetical protein [Tanacetum cinerariifolium]
MDLYHSRLTLDDLNYLIIKYKIPRDLYPRLPLEGFVMSKLSDDAIGIYHQIFDFFGVRMGLNKVIIFEHWKSCFFLIDRWDISDAMVWRHSDAAIDDPRPAAGSFNMANVRCLSARVIKLRDMPEGVLVLSGLSRVWKNRFCDPVLRGADRNGDDDESDDDDDACVEIPLVTHLRSSTVILPQGTRVGVLLLLLLKTLTLEGKSIMFDDVVVPSGGNDVVGNCEFTREEWDAPHQPTFKIITKEVFKDLVVCKTIVDQFPTPGKMVSRLNDKLATSGASFSMSKGNERKKNIKSLSKSLDNLHSEVARLSAVINKIFKYVVEPLSVILQLKPKNLVRPANVLILMDTRVSTTIAKESTVTPVPKSFELSANVAHVSSVITSEQNKEQVNVVVDRSDFEMADGATPSKSGGVFVQGVSHVLDDVIEATVVESERIFCVPTDVVVALSVGGKATVVESERIFCVPTDVVVALSVGGKGDGSVPSFTVEKEMCDSEPVEWDCCIYNFLFVPSFLFCCRSEAAIPANSALQSMAWLDALNFNWMAYEYIFSSRLIMMIPTPELSSIVSLPKYNLKALVVGVEFA